MKTRTFKILVISFLFIASGLKAQKSSYDYQTGIGFRGGLTSGLTFKHFTGDKSAIEFIAATRYKGFLITGLYELHNQAFDVDGLKWFYGLGGHVGRYAPSRYWEKYGRYEKNYLSVGVDGIFGLEYFIREIPFTVSLDVKPYIDINHYHFNFWDGALSIRYAF